MCLDTIGRDCWDRGLSTVELACRIRLVADIEIVVVWRFVPAAVFLYWISPFVRDGTKWLGIWIGEAATIGGAVPPARPRG